MSSTKNRTKIVISAMPSTHEYSVIGPVRHSLVRFSFAGTRSYNVLVCRFASLIVFLWTYVNKSSGYNDTRTKVLCEEESPLWYTEALSSRSKHGKPRS